MLDERELINSVLNKGVLEIAVKDIQSMSKEDYALVRKNYFGASDSSVLCGVNLYKTIPELIKEKNCKYLTDEERAVGEKPIVKKGYDLEPIILGKAEDELNTFLWKPKDMFRFKNVTGLSVNYDGLTPDLIPVEAKLVSKYGEKYYNKNITRAEAENVDMTLEGTDLVGHIKRKALRFGIPAYYYTQVQQEMAGIDAPYGYLAAMFDETWTFKLFYIKRDDYVINSIYKQCELNITKIERELNN